MKYKRMIALWLCLILFLGGCRSGKEANAVASGQEESGNMSTVVLYYTNSDQTELIQSQEQMDHSKPPEVLVSEIYEKLLDPSKTHDLPEEAFSVIPEGVVEKLELRTANSATYVNKMVVLYVTVSKAFENLSNNQKLVFRTGFSQAMFSSGAMLQIRFVTNTSKGEEIVDLMTANERMIINQYDEDFYSDAVRVKLYFADEKKEKLVAEERILNLSMTEPLPAAIIKALIAGPTTEGLSPTIPSGTQINDVVFEDGICYIDLNEEFQLNHSGGEMQELLTIYSVVDSLLSVPGFTCCQFLINGKRVEYYKTYVNLDGFLEPNMDLVEVDE